MSGYGYHGMWHGGLELFSAMPRNVEQPDRYSMVTLVSCLSQTQKHLLSLKLFMEFVSRGDMILDIM
jgi:pentatricopeptide repeat protein